MFGGELPSEVLIAYSGMGVIINKATFENGKHVLYISVPSSSYLQNDRGVQLAGSVLAERIKQHLNSKPGKYPAEVKYQIRTQHWTENLKWRAEMFMRIELRKKGY